MPSGQFSYFRDIVSLDRPGHGTLWVNSGMIPAIPGRLATLGNFPLCKSFSAYKILSLTQHTKFLLLINLAIFEI